MAENILEVKNLTKDYGDFVLNDLSFSIDMQGYGIRITTKGVFETTVEKPKVAVCPKCGEVSLYIENFKSIK